MEVVDGGGSGLNAVSVALAEILMNRVNIVGTGLDGILSNSLGLKPTQILAVISMFTPVLSGAEINVGDGEAWSKNWYTSQVGQTPESIVINNAANIISNIGKRNELREILENLSLASYKELGEMKQHKQYRYRGCLLHWKLNQTHPVLFSLEDNKIPLLCIIQRYPSYA